MSKLTKLLIFIPLLSFCSRALSKSPKVIEGAMVYQFTRYITWPEDQLNSKKSFDIGIISDEALSQVLKDNLKTRTIHDLPVKFTGLSDLTKSQVIVVGQNSDRQSPLIKRKLNECICIIIGYYGEAYEHITLRTVDQKLRFEINLKLAKEKGFYISSRLLNLALKVKN